MKLYIIILTLLFCNTQLQAQDYIRELDRKTDKPLLRGQLNFDDILEESTCSWLEQGSKKYKPSDMVVKKLATLLPKYRMIVFIGTWCEDTQNLLPQFHKTMVQAGFDFNAMEMYGVNRSKAALNVEHKLYNISRVPTFIIMDRFREVGRITESVNNSIEEDLLDILERDMLSRQK